MVTTVDGDSSCPQPGPRITPLAVLEASVKANEARIASSSAEALGLEGPDAKRLRTVLEDGDEDLPDWYAISQVGDPGEECQEIAIPPACPTPRIRLLLKSRIKTVRCTKKSFAPREFSGFIGSNRKKAHTSHSLAAARGVVWCWRCGKVAVTKPKGLVRPCSGAPSPFGKRTLERLRKGLPPFHLKDWPTGDQVIYRQLTVCTTTDRTWERSADG